MLGRATPPRFDGLRALFLDCSLKRSPEMSHTDGLIERSAALMRGRRVTSPTATPRS